MALSEMGLGSGGPAAGQGWRTIKTFFGLGKKFSENIIHRIMFRLSVPFPQGFSLSEIAL
jgi:hypothetical protein